MDSRVEILERTLGRMIERKRKIPDAQDLWRITKDTDAIINADLELVKALAWLAAGFAI